MLIAPRRIETTLVVKCAFVLARLPFPACSGLFCSIYYSSVYLLAWLLIISATAVDSAAFPIPKNISFRSFGLVSV